MSYNKADLNEIILHTTLDGTNETLLKFSDGSINYLGNIVKQFFTSVLIHNLSETDVFVSTVINANLTIQQGIKTIPANTAIKFYKDSIIQLSLFANNPATVEILCYKDI